MATQLLGIVTEETHQRPHIKEIRRYYDPKINRYYCIVEKKNGKTKMTQMYGTYIEAYNNACKVK